MSGVQTGPSGQHVAPGLRPFAVVTGASSGIGLEIARRLAEEGHDLLVCAEDEGIAVAADALAGSTPAAAVTALQADLATGAGIVDLVAAVRETERPLDVLVLNAGVGVAGAFLDSELEEQVRLLRLDVEALVRLTHELVPAMVARGAGRVLVTASVAATMPGPWYATYAAAKAFDHSFALALRAELHDTGVTVTVLLPGPTDTEFFDRAGMAGSPIRAGHLTDPAVVAEKAVAGLLSGDAEVMVGPMARAQAVLARVLPDRAAAAVHGAMTRPREPDEPAAG